MKVILHIGAHRTGTTTFQAYMRQHTAALRAEGVGFWGPMRTRKGLFAGVQPVPGLGLSGAHRARGRIMLQMDKAARAGVETLVVSDENMMGAPRLNLRMRSLYPDAGERMARYACAFDGRIDKVVMSVRVLDHFWGSTAAFAVARGHLVPCDQLCETIAQGARSWRDVIADVACAVPGAEIEVTPFETVIGRPDLTLATCTGQTAPRPDAVDWLNRRPSANALRAILVDRGEDPDQVPANEARWTPFNEHTRAALRETYADDMHWLVAGANGVATLTEDRNHTSAGRNRPAGLRNRGQSDDIQERRMAQPR
ncbi:MAG: hypothetical protein AAF214_05955 [Pseudomonadota bacterium]